MNIAIAEKPLYWVSRRGKNIITSTAHYRCPNCGKEITVSRWDHHICVECGQKLDWSQPTKFTPEYQAEREQSVGML